jgi:hypothetical protein
MEKRIDGVKYFGGGGRPRSGLETGGRVTMVIVCQEVLEIAPPSLLLGLTCRGQRRFLSYNARYEVFKHASRVEIAPPSNLADASLRILSEVSNNAEAPLVYKRSRQDGVSGTPFRTTPLMKSLNTLRVGDSGAPFRTTPLMKSLNTLRMMVSEVSNNNVSDNVEAPLVFKRSRHVGDSGATFRTTPVMKYLNTLRVGVSGATFRTAPIMKMLNTLRVYGERNE